jgi:hypothetical protein
MTAWKSASLWIGSLLVCGWAASASAQPCDANEDCPKGYSCQPGMSVSVCGTTPACAPGEACPEPAPCPEPESTLECQPAACTTDADCGESMRCYTRTVGECNGGAAAPACEPNQDCPMPEPVMETCTETTIQLCVPRYLLECAQDSDCGEGFSCEAREECMCGGSAPDVPPADGGSAPDMGSGSSGFAPREPAQDAGAPRETCECHPSETKHCELKVVSCTEDRDCPSEMTCRVYGSGDAVSCAAPRDGSEPKCDPAPEDTVEEKRCEPRAGWWGPDSSHSEDGDVASASGPLPTRGDDKGGSGSDAGTVAPEAAAESSGMSAAANSCSVTAPRAAGLSVWLAPFGIAVVALGLRARRRAMR